MLDQFSFSPDSTYARAVKPSYEGHLRAESSRPSNLTQNDHKNVQRNQTELVDKNRQEIQRRTQAAESEQQKPLQSQASLVADKLFQQVQRARQEPARQTYQQRSTDYGQRQKLNRTYVADNPTASKRFVDEIA